MWRLPLELFLVATVLGFAALAWADEPTLVFDDIKTLEMAASLQADCKAGDAPPSYDGLPKRLTPHFALYHDPRSIKLFSNGGMFQYMFYVEDRSAAPSTWFACGTQLTPQGTFADKFQDVHFTISRNGMKEEGTIKVPVHSLANNDFLDFSKPALPNKIDLSGPQDLEIPLRSVVTDFPIIISRSVTLAPVHRAYWVPDPEDKVLLPSDIALRQSGTIKIPIPPVRRMTALLGTMTSLKPDGVHDTLGIDLSYKSDLGGADRIKHIDLDVRFVPSLPSLVLALLFGSLVGTLAGLMLPDAWKGRRRALETAGRALLYSAVAELGAIFMVAQGSKFVLFGAELDPWQFLSVFFIGFLTSGGKAVVQLIRPVSETAAGDQKKQPPKEPPTVPETREVTS